jgi:Family of unknown function (DUF6526)
MRDTPIGIIALNYTVRHCDRIPGRHVGAAKPTSDLLRRPSHQSALLHFFRSRTGGLEMAEKTPQTLANHTRFDPWFHFFLLPIFGLGVLFSLIHFLAHLGHADFRDNFHAVLLILLASALVILVLKVRFYSLKVQDRIIRLEERLRLAEILPDPLRRRIPELTEDQLCGLRFASDAELSKLVERTLNEKLSRKQIKQAVESWRPDDWRV